MLKKIFGSWQGAVPTIIRVVVGFAFMALGYRKVFVLGFAKITEHFAEVRAFPFPQGFAFVVSYFELLGGIALILGIKTRWVALLFCIEMLAAIFATHIQHGYWYGPRTGDGFANALNLFTFSLSLLIMGAGRWSIDAAKGWDD